MSVLVRFGKQKAILRLGEWWSADPSLEDRLNAATARWFAETGGPPISDRDHERTLADEISRRMGGRIFLHVRSSRRRTVQTYISRRQLALDFS